MLADTYPKPITKPPKLPFYVPVFNHVVRSFLRVGVPMGYVGLLTVKGRNTGKARRNPVGLFEYHGHRYLSSTFGDVNWVQNRAARIYIIPEVRHFTFEGAPEATVENFHEWWAKTQGLADLSTSSALAN